MSFPTIPTTGAGRIITGVQADQSATRTSPNLNTLTKASGDLLIAICVAYQLGSTGTTDQCFSGWTGSFTEFHDTGSTSTICIGCAYKWSTGSETGTISVTQASGTITGDACWLIMAIPGVHATSPPEAGGRTSVAGASSNASADPGALDPAGWATEDTLWIAVHGNGETSTSGAWQGVSAAPSGWTGFAASAQSQDAVGGVQVGVAFLQSTAASADPGTFTSDGSNARSGAITIAVRPVFVVEKTGLGASDGAVSSGVQGVDRQKTGLGAGTTTAAGGQGVDHQKTGLGAGGATGSGGQIVESAAPEWTVSIDLAKVVVVYAPVAPTGVVTKTGKAVAEAVATGAQTIAPPTTSEKVGAGAAVAVPAGVQAVQLHVETEKVGLGAATATAAGVQAITYPVTSEKAGLGAATAAAAGVQAISVAGEIAKAGLAAATAAAAGTQTVTHPTTSEKAGLGASTAAALGPETVTYPITSEKAGLAAATTAAAGTQIIAAPTTSEKAGLAVATAVATGPQATQLHVESAKVGLGAATAAALGAQAVAYPTTSEKAGLGAATGVPTGVQVLTPATQHVKAATAVVDAVPTGWARITTGLLWAGSATGVSGTWVDTANAVGASTGDYATWTSSGSGAAAVLELATFGASAAVPSLAVLDAVTVTVRHADDPADRLSAMSAQVYLGAAPYGSAQPLTTSATAHDDTITVTGLTYADLADLRVRITATRV